MQRSHSKTTITSFNPKEKRAQGAFGDSGTKTGKGGSVDKRLAPTNAWGEATDSHVEDAGYNGPPHNRSKIDSMAKAKKDQVYTTDGGGKG